MFVAQPDLGLSQRFCSSELLRLIALMKFKPPPVFSQMLVGKFTGYADVDHSTEMANEVRRASKELKECQALAQTYNTRERLFGNPVTNVSPGTHVAIKRTGQSAYQVVA